MPRSAIIRGSQATPAKGSKLISTAGNASASLGVTAKGLSATVPVLLVEDLRGFDQVLVRLIKRAIPTAVVDVCELEVEARVRLATNAYKVLVIDYELPDGHGPNLLKDLVRERQIIGVVLQSGLEEVAGASSPPSIVRKPTTPYETDAFINAVQQALIRPLRTEFSPATVLQLARAHQALRIKRAGLFESLRTGMKMRDVAAMNRLGYEAVRKATRAGMYGTGMASRRNS